MKTSKKISKKEKYISFIRTFLFVLAFPLFIFASFFHSQYIIVYFLLWFFVFSFVSLFSKKDESLPIKNKEKQIQQFLKREKENRIRVFREGGMRFLHFSSRETIILMSTLGVYILIALFFQKFYTLPELIYSFFYSLNNDKSNWLMPLVFSFYSFGILVFISFLFNFKKLYKTTPLFVIQLILFFRVFSIVNIIWGVLFYLGFFKPHYWIHFGINFCYSFIIFGLIILFILDREFFAKKKESSGQKINNL